MKINYLDITLSEIERDSNNNYICDGDKKEIIIEEKDS